MGRSAALVGHAFKDVDYKACGSFNQKHVLAGYDSLKTGRRPAQPPIQITRQVALGETRRQGAETFPLHGETGRQIIPLGQPWRPLLAFPLAG